MNVCMHMYVCVHVREHMFECVRWMQITDHSLHGWQDPFDKTVDVTMQLPLGLEAKLDWILCSPAVQVRTHASSYARSSPACAARTHVYTN
jgi:hypothetical protein